MTKLLESLLAYGVPRRVATAMAAVPGANHGTIRCAAANRVGEIRIYGNIGFDWDGAGMTPTKFADELKALGELDELVIRINSWGGLAYDGITINSIIAQLGVPTKTIIEGMAASAGSIVAIGSDTVVMLPTAQMMIHQAAVFAQGNADDLREIAAWLEIVDAQLADIYAARSDGKKTKAELLEAMRVETYLTPAEAIDFGLADAVLEPPKKGKAKNEAAPPVGAPAPVNRVRAKLAAMRRKFRIS